MARKPKKDILLNFFRKMSSCNAFSNIRLRIRSVHLCTLLLLTIDFLGQKLVKPQNTNTFYILLYIGIYEYERVYFVLLLRVGIIRQISSLPFISLHYCSKQMIADVHYQSLSFTKKKFLLSNCSNHSCTVVKRLQLQVLKPRRYYPILTLKFQSFPVSCVQSPPHKYPS